MIDGICLVLQKGGGEMMCLRKSIYEQLAKKYKTDIRNVERCIRHVIGRWWYRQKCGMLFERKPTNSELICHLVEYIRLGIGVCKVCESVGLLQCDCDKSTRQLSIHETL